MSIVRTKKLENVKSKIRAIKGSLSGFSEAQFKGYSYHEYS